MRQFFVYLVFLVAHARTRNLRLVNSGARLQSPASAHTAVYDGDDSIYSFGGYYSSAGNFGWLDTITRYSLSTGVVEVVGKFSAGTQEGSVAATGDGVLHFGGWFSGTSGGYTAAIQYFSSATNSVTPVGSLPERASDMAIAWDSRREVAYLFGGYSTVGRKFDSVVAYNASSQRAEQVARLPERRYRASAVWDEHQQAAYIFGGLGETSAPWRDILRYDPTTSIAYKLDVSLPNSETSPCAVYSPEEGVSYMVGYQTITRFDPVSQQVETLDIEDLYASLERTTCTFVPKLNRIYILGGSGRFANETNTSYRDEIMYIDLYGEDPKAADH